MIITEHTLRVIHFSKLELALESEALEHQKNVLFDGNTSMRIIYEKYARSVIRLLSTVHDTPKQFAWPKTTEFHVRGL